MARSTFYYHLKRLGNTSKYKEEKKRIKEIFQESKGRYGYRRITLQLRNDGYVINHKTVEKLMQDLGIKCLIRKKRYRSYKGTVGKIAPNILNRDFKADCPYSKLATDVSQISIGQQKSFLSPIIDMFNGEILSYNVSDRADLEQINKMLKDVFAITDKAPAGNKILLHSDQGWQYQHKDYQNALAQHGIIQSMSRKGNCLDNSVMENFFGIMKSELLYSREFKSMQEFKEELEKYIDWYNKKNIPSIKPVTAGTNCIFPRLCDCSSAGIRRLQTDAAIITPAAKPLSIFVVFTESSFFIKSTHAAPSDVPINGINKPNMVDVIMVASYSAVLRFFYFTQTSHI